MVKICYDHASKRRDARGFLVDFLKGDEVPLHSKKLGQIYFVTFDSVNAIRGNHFHRVKNEWFVVVSGKVKFVAKDIKTNKRYYRILDGDHDKYERVFVGRNVAHAFQNISPIAAMINYADKPYHAKDSDTIYYQLL